ncbi:MAG: N-acetylglucosamine-6-phosphate deacetylase [Vampirovibrionales bacterium]|nr:N-acetylglucosamine-6-phosphate deacetylase [Vampirovibrionales bacterium]
MTRHGALTLIAGARVLKPDGRFYEETVILEGARILALEAETPGALLLNHDDVEVINAEGALLTPGLIDLHINGAFGCDFNAAPIAEIQRALRLLAARGVTSVAPTVITAATMDMLTAINTLEETIHQARPDLCRMIAIHVEGPYISARYRGAHPAEDIPESIGIEELRAFTSPHVRIMTLAPERDPQGLKIQYLTEKGVRVNAGHTNAGSDEITRAVSQGVSGVTHLYNAMRPFHHRDPGVIGATLAIPQLYAEIIADGVHVHPTALQAAVRAKGLNRIMLVSDAMALAGLPEGSQCVFAGQTVTLRRGEARNEEGNLAGAAFLLDDCIRRLVKSRTLGFEQALTMASATPAEYLGRSEDLGRIAPGCLADLVLWDAATLTAKATWVDGKLVYEADAALNRGLSRAALS